MTLEFEELSHTYAWDGARVPSVTTVIRPLEAYSRMSEEMLRPYAERGTAVHSMTEKWDNDECDLAEIDHSLYGYLTAWIDFRSDHDFQPIAIEQRLYHGGRGFAGTIDRVGRVRGRISVVDIKTSAKLGPAIGVQLAGYKELWNWNERRDEHAYGRYAVQLAGDGTYRLMEYDCPLDVETFYGCLAIHNWLEEVKSNHKVLIPDVRPRVAISDESQWPRFELTDVRTGI